MDEVALFCRRRGLLVIGLRIVVSVLLLLIIDASLMASSPP